MSPAELTAELTRISARLGSEARASLVLLGNSSDTLARAAIESTWRISKDKLEFRACDETFEGALAALDAEVDRWIEQAPLRNRTMTAEDLGLEVAA